MLKNFIFLIFFANCSLALPVSNDLKLLTDLKCSEELLAKALPNENVKNQCNITIDSTKKKLESNEKLCLALHIQVEELCQNGKAIGNAHEVLEVKFLFLLKKSNSLSF